MPKGKKRKIAEETVASPKEVKKPEKAANSGFDLKSLLTEESWADLLSDEFEEDYMKQLEKLISKDIQDGKTVFPPQDEIFNAFTLTPFEQVKLVILGQDPYHDDGQAHGLSFSVKPGIKFPPSLKNIFKELLQEYGDYTVPKNGNLEAWAKQGVLLLNATRVKDKYSSARLRRV